MCWLCFAATRCTIATDPPSIPHAYANQQNENATTTITQPPAIHLFDHDLSHLRHILAILQRDAAGRSVLARRSQMVEKVLAGILLASDDARSHTRSET